MADTHRTRIRHYLQLHPSNAYTDRELATALQINESQVGAECRLLVLAGLVDREFDAETGRIITRWSPKR
jgi:DNA-binding MarR family transcriptional regulator